MEIMMTQILETYARQISMMLLLLALLAFTVSLITEVTKNLGPLSRIPTDIQVIVLSLVLCVVGYFAYISYRSIAFTWYVFLAAVVLSFFVAFLAMYGWGKMAALWSRFAKGSL